MTVEWEEAEPEQTERARQLCRQFFEMVQERTPSKFEFDRLCEMFDQLMMQTAYAQAVARVCAECAWAPNREMTSFEQSVTKYALGLPFIPIGVPVEAQGDGQEENQGQG